jgi:hypothetical protein
VVVSIDIQNCPESIMDFHHHVFSSRRSKNVLGSSHLVLGWRKWLFGCWTSQSRLRSAKLTWQSFSKARIDYTIVFLSLS